MAPCSTHPKPWPGAAPISRAAWMQTLRPGVNPPRGPRLGWLCLGGDTSPCQRASSDPTASSSPSPLSLAVPFCLSPYPRGSRELGGCSGPSPQGCPAAASREVGPGLAPWTRSGALPGSNSDGDILGGTTQGHNTVLCRAATRLGTSGGTQGHNIVLCGKAMRVGTAWGGGTRCSALQGSNADGDITGERGDTQQRSAGKQHGCGHP